MATAFLTRVPVRTAAGAADVNRAARWFPLIGAALGATGALAAWGLHDVLGVPPLATATTIVALGAWATGAIHLDGVADTADGFGGGRTREDVLRIMRDPEVGSFGAIALVLVIMMKAAALAALLERDAALPFIVAAPALSRWTIVVLAAWLPYARPDGGLGQSVARGRHMPGLPVATATTAVITVVMLRADAFLPSMLAALTTVVLGRAARRRIGGVTGDVFGAGVELSETMVLVGGVLLTGRA